MKIYAVNGSPRHQGNTAILLQYALDGAASKGAETELIHLADYQFSGCKSCFACKLKNSPTYGRCAVNDELTPVLEKLLTGDGIIFGTPIYFGGETGMFRNLIERLYFAKFRYDQAHSSLITKKIRSAFVYTMNVTKEDAEQHHYSERLRMLRAFGGHLFNTEEPQVLMAYNTKQFDDYSKYDAPLFDPEDKSRSRVEQFPADCRNAFGLGAEMTVEF